MSAASAACLARAAEQADTEGRGAAACSPARHLSPAAGMMPAEPPHSPVIEAVRSLEARWIFPGPLETAVARWFGRFPAMTESREDIYLLDPQLRGLSVKIRAGEALQVKVYRGSRGILQVPGRARGRLEAWQKWSFPCARVRPGPCPQAWNPAWITPGPTRSG